MSAWSWTYVCPTGLRPWLPDTKQLAPCFQQLFLQVPILILFAAISAYHSGRIANGMLVHRNRVQRITIHIRMLVVLALGVFPVFKYFYILRTGMEYWPIDILVGSIEMIVFAVHLGKPQPTSIDNHFSLNLHH